MNHNNNFHFVRLLAALLVVISHAFQHTGAFDEEPLLVLTGKTMSASAIGLYMFFFTSGYLVTRSALESENSIHFLFKRMLRIHPALIVLVLISVFIAGPLLTRLNTADYYQHADTWKYLINMLGVGTRAYLPGVFDGPEFIVTTFNLPLWSISLELKLYLVLAISLALGLLHKRRIHLWICVGIILGGWLIWFMDRYGYAPVKFLRRDVAMVITFFLGSLIQTWRPSAKLLAITGMVAFLVFILRCTRVLETTLLMDQVLLVSIATYFIAYTKKFTIHLRNDISYGVYLYSVPIQQCCFILSGYNHNPWLNMLMALGPIIGIGWLSWKCIEQPSLQLKPYYHKVTAALNPGH